MKQRSRARLVVLLAASLTATSCGGGDGDGAVSATTTTTLRSATPGTATTTDTIDDEPAESSASTQPPTTGGVTTTTTPPDCPDVPPPPLDEPAVELPSPVDPDAQPYETGEGQLFGRFGFESLGVAIAFDAAPAMFFVDTPPSDQEVVFGARGLHPTFLRPVGLRADGSRPLSADTPTISFDEWLAIWSDEMGIIDDTTTIVGGRDARAITFLPPNGSDLDTQRFKLHDRELLLNDRWPTRIVRVDLDDPNPLYIVIGRNDPPDAPERPDWIEITDEWLATIAIGDIVPSPAQPWPGASWDTGGLLRDNEVDGPCQVSSVAIGGVEFEVAEPSWLSVSGDEIWIRDPAQRHVGVDEPVIRLIAPSFAWNQASVDSDGTAGATVATVDDALAQFARQGWQLDQVDDDATLLDADARIFEFVGPDQPSYLFAPGSHAGSAPEDLAFPPHRVGRAILADTTRGVVIAMLDAETDTDDTALLAERFDRLIATLTFVS